MSLVIFFSYLDAVLPKVTLIYVRNDKLLITQIVHPSWTSQYIWSLKKKQITIKEWTFYSPLKLGSMKWRCIAKNVVEHWLSLEICFLSSLALLLASCEILESSFNLSLSQCNLSSKLSSVSDTLWF